MHPPLSPRVGGVMSADIAVPEHERMSRFYARVLTTGERPLWRDDLMNHLGMPIIGLGQRTEAYAHLPLQWMPHIQVADVDQSVEAAREQGGTELMHAKGDDGRSQWAVLADPQGCAFGLIPVVSAEHIPAVDDGVTTGHITGMFLSTSDWRATCGFYETVVGWSRGTTSDDGATLLDSAGHVAATVRAATPEGPPPAWVLLLPVGDLAESLRRIEPEGGKIIEATTEGPHARVVLEDPVGAVIGLVPG